MTTGRLLTTDWFLDHYGQALERLLASSPAGLEPIIVPADGAKLSAEDLQQITVAFFHGDFRSDQSFTRRFFGTCLRSPNLEWMHVPNSGVDDPVFARLLANSVRLTTSPGAAAEPIAQTAITGLLMLARGFPHWLDAQRRRSWEPHEWDRAPADLSGQQVLLVGTGAIGSHIARLAKALGMKVAGVRRRADDRPPGFDAIHSTTQLAALVADADWLVLACPLTEETRNLVGAELLARLKPTAHLINVSRGEVVDERALCDALAAGRLAGAYLDVFTTEPLPAESPLWSYPNVIVTPHDSPASRGNAHRVSELFLDNLARWLRNEPLLNEVGPAKS